MSLPRPALQSDADAANYQTLLGALKSAGGKVGELPIKGDITSFVAGFNKLLEGGRLAVPPQARQSLPPPIFFSASRNATPPL